jgi:hypothetical protein
LSAVSRRHSAKFRASRFKWDFGNERTRANSCEPALPILWWPAGRGRGVPHAQLRGGGTELNKARMRTTLTAIIALSRHSEDSVLSDVQAKVHAMSGRQVTPSVEQPTT